MADLADYYGIYDPTALDEAFLSDIGPNSLDRYPEPTEAEMRELAEHWRKADEFEELCYQKQEQNLEKIKRLGLNAFQIEAFAKLAESNLQLDSAFGIAEKEKLYFLIDILLECQSFFPQDFRELAPPISSSEDEDIPF